MRNYDEIRANNTAKVIVAIAFAFGGTTTIMMSAGLTDKIVVVLRHLLP